MYSPARIQAEFTRQSEALAAAAAFTDADILARILAEAAPTRTPRVLDVGCGPGILLTALSPLTGAVVGVDFTPKMLELARERCRTAGFDNGRFELGQAETLPFPDGSFAAVVTRLMLHHLPSGTGESRRKRNAPSGSRGRCLSAGSLRFKPSRGTAA
jgi:SAM-dependent methyltransferase